MAKKQTMAKLNKFGKLAKNIHLSEKAVKFISIEAIKEETNFKHYVENLLENLAKSKRSAK